MIFRRREGPKVEKSAVRHRTLSLFSAADLGPKGDSALLRHQDIAVASALPEALAAQAQAQISRSPAYLLWRQSKSVEGIAKSAGFRRRSKLSFKIN